MEILEPIISKRLQENIYAGMQKKRLPVRKLHGNTIISKLCCCKVTFYVGSPEIRVHGIRDELCHIKYSHSKN